MSSIALQTSQEAVLSSIGAQDDSGNPLPAAFSAQIAPYSVAYVANDGGVLHVVAKTVGTATLTISGHSQNGTALPNQTQDFTVSAPPVPQATHFVIGSWTVKGDDITTPLDPGTDTVNGTV
jgi:hypothetical protein